MLCKVCKAWSGASLVVRQCGIYIQVRPTIAPPPPPQPPGESNVNVADVNSGFTQIYLT